MKVNLEKLPPSLATLEIEIDEERLEPALNDAYRRVVKKIKVPGFRPGKAPRSVVESRIGREGLIQEALDKLVPEVYNEAIESENLEPIAEPAIEVLELDPVRFKAILPLKPTIQLGEYTDVYVEPEAVEVTDEMFEEQMDALRRRFATLLPVERPVQWGDILTADVFATVEDQTFAEDKDVVFPLVEGRQLFLPELAEAFVDMEVGEEKKVDIAVPEDFVQEGYRGKTANFTINIKEIKEEELPDEDDDLAKQLNLDDVATIDDLKERVRSDILENLQRSADDSYRMKAIDEMIELAEIEYPLVLVEREIDVVIRETHGNDIRNYQAHLAQIGQSQEEFRESLRESAELRVTRNLIVSTFAEEEGIEITDVEIEEERQKMLDSVGEENAQLKELFTSDVGTENLRQRLFTEKTLGEIQKIASTQSGESEKNDSQENDE
ncbi:MAG: trigger factor [Tepidiformaceae bacterium]